MGSSDIALLGVLGFLALGLSWLAIRVSMLVWRMAAAISWLVLGILFWTNALGTSIGDPWVYALSLVFFLMIIAVLTLQMKSDIQHERSVRGNLGGYPGASSESWTTWGPRKRAKKSTALERQSEYKELLRGKKGQSRK